MAAQSLHFTVIASTHHGAYSYRPLNDWCKTSDVTSYGLTIMVELQGFNCVYCEIVVRK